MGTPARQHQVGQECPTYKFNWRAVLAGTDKTFKLNVRGYGSYTKTVKHSRFK